MTSKLRQEITSIIQTGIDRKNMDVYNISEMILEFYKEPVLTYWGDSRFIALSVGGRLLGYIPRRDNELLDRVKELTSLGWDNSDRRIPLDRTSWNMQHEHIRRMIMEL